MDTDGDGLADIMEREINTDQFVRDTDDDGLSDRIEFDFRSDARGEVHGIGFDTDNRISSNRTFQLFGSQTWGIQDYRTYLLEEDWVHYEIPIGQFYTGSFPHLFFSMDHDVRNPTGQSTFRNITIYESG